MVTEKRNCHICEEPIYYIEEIDCMMCVNLHFSDRDRFDEIMIITHRLNIPITTKHLVKLAKKHGLFNNDSMKLAQLWHTQDERFNPYLYIVKLKWYEKLFKFLRKIK